MDNKKKDSYLVAGTFVILGLIFLYTSWRQLNLVFFIGVGLTILGAAGFKWPEVAEVLVHWAKKQGKAEQSYHKQTQKNAKNSNQVITDSGDVHIHQYGK